MRRLLAALLLAPTLAAAGEPWDGTDQALGAVTLTATVIDWGQTRSIAKHPEQWRETNRVLGEHPSAGRVDAYFIGVIAATALLADWLVPRNRKLFLGAVAAVEFAVTARNRSLGIKIAF